MNLQIMQRDDEGGDVRQTVLSKQASSLPLSLGELTASGSQIQAASGCQALLCFDTQRCPQQKHGGRRGRGKVAAEAFANAKIHSPFVFLVPIRRTNKTFAVGHLRQTHALEAEE